MLKLRLTALLLMGFGLSVCLSATQAQDQKKEPAKEAPKDAKAAEKAPAVPAPSAPSDGKIDFTLKLEKDKPFYQEVRTVTTQSIKVVGMDVSQVQDQTYYFKWLPIKFEGNKWTIKQTIEGLKLKIDIGGNPIQIDTESSAPAGANPAPYDFIKALKNSEFTLSLSDKYKVEKIEGKDEFFKKILQSNAQMEAILKTILTDEALKQMSDPTFGFIPAEPKKIGDTWKSTSKLNLGPLGTYDNTYTYTFKSKEPDDKYKLEVVSDVVYTAPTTNDAGLPFKIKAADLKSKDKTPGIIIYNAKTGRVDSAEFVLKLAGTITIEIGGTPTTVEVIQDQSTTIRSSDKSFIPEKKATN